MNLGNYTNYRTIDLQKYRTTELHELDELHEIQNYKNYMNYKNYSTTELHELQNYKNYRTTERNRTTCIYPNNYRYYKKYKNYRYKSIIGDALRVAYSRRLSWTYYRFLQFEKAEQTILIVSFYYVISLFYFNICQSLIYDVN